MAWYYFWAVIACEKLLVGLYKFLHMDHKRTYIFYVLMHCLWLLYMYYDIYSSVNFKQFYDHKNETHFIKYKINCQNLNRIIKGNAQSPARSMHCDSAANCVLSNSKSVVLRPSFRYIWWEYDLYKPTGWLMMSLLTAEAHFGLRFTT